jgi:exonuclease VII small subunit
MPNRQNQNDNASVDTLNTQDTRSTQDTSSFRQREPVNFDDISLSVVSYNQTFRRKKGALGQIVKSLEDMVARLNEPTNDYQKGLYPEIQSKCKHLVDRYNELVSNVNKDDYSLVGYYLNGPRNNGSRRATRTRHEFKTYGTSEYKETLKSLNDRLRHIKNDCNRKRRDENRDDRDSLERLVAFCDTYHEDVNRCLQEWDEFIVKFREEKGIKPKPRTNIRRVGNYNRRYVSRNTRNRNYVNNGRDNNRREA